MLLIDDLPAAHRSLAANQLACPATGCTGQLGPWGWARRRVVRRADGSTDRYAPRRARCRACRRTQVLASTSTFPRRADHAETVGRALLAAMSGLGHRRIAEALDRPHTTVRGWLRRAEANADRAWAHAVRWVLQLDPTSDPFPATPLAPLAATVEAVGLAIAARSRFLGPVEHPWTVAVLVTGGLLLAPAHHGPSGHPLDMT